MSIDPATVDRVAHLARLSLTDQEREVLTVQLQTILEYFARLQELDLAAVGPSSHILASSGSLRDDEVKPSLARADVLGQAPSQEDGFFKVPPVLDPV